MAITGAAVHLRSGARPDAIGAMLNQATTGGPFVVTSVVATGGDGHHCTFRLRRPDISVGYRSVIELQYLIDKSFDIVKVECDDTLTGQWTGTEQ